MGWRSLKSSISTFRRKIIRSKARPRIMFENVRETSMEILGIEKTGFGECFVMESVLFSNF